MRSKLIALILQLPLILLVIASFFASIYAAAKHIGGIGYATCFILAIVILLYFAGRYVERKRRLEV